MFPYVVAATALGLAQGAVAFFIEETRHRITSYTTTLMSDHSTTQLRLGEAASAVEAAELLLLANCQAAMAAAEASRVPGVDEKIRLRRDGAYAAKLCTHAVDLLFEAGGGEFLYEEKPMQRMFRDVHAAQSHYALTWDVAAAAAGKFMLGISPDSPTL
jgi:3-hydroxy-9,10-secoandrosta-1,3,5(10)-triene-9,17-dione monooxygenase